MSENEESRLVDEKIQQAKQMVGEHARDAIAIVSSCMSVAELRHRMKEVAMNNVGGLLDSLGHHDHRCGLPRAAVMTASMNLRLLFLPLATNPATGESLAVFRERVCVAIEREREEFIREIEASRSNALDYLNAMRELSVMIATEELKHGATLN